MQDSSESVKVTHSSSAYASWEEMTGKRRAKELFAVVVRRLESVHQRTSLGVVGLDVVLPVAKLSSLSILESE